MTTQKSNDTTIYFGASVLLTAGATHSMPITYNWTPSTGLNCTNCDTVIATPPVGTIDYTVISTNTFGCAISNNILVNTLSVNDPNVSVPHTPEMPEESFTISPNPSAGSFVLHWVNTPLADAEITINDITGRAVYNSVMQINTPTGEKHFTIAELTNGLYMLHIKSIAFQYRQKILIHL